MKTYEVHYRLNGKVYKEYISTNYAYKVREIIRARCPGCQITSVREV